MTHVASVAAGREAADSLYALHNRNILSGSISFVRHGDIAVAWAARSEWVETYDDGVVLVVLDGRLHDEPGVGSQAEALHQRYRALGRDAAADLLGDFVFIVLDRATQSLVVARDPLGVRPWYQAKSGDRVAGASDLATLAALLWVDTNVNARATIEYLAAMTESRGDTFYSGIETLRPGETWTTVAGVVETFPHQHWNFQPDLRVTWEEAAERCRSLLDNAVRCRLEAGGPATSQLSGGLDSSSVVGTIAQLGYDELLVGRLDFEGHDADESVFSDAVIDYWGLPAVTIPPWLPDLDEARELTRDLKRPLPDPNFTMFIDLERALLERGRSDSLTGLGGDDAFVAMGVGSRVVSTIQLRQGYALGQMLRANLLRPRTAWYEILRPTLHYLAPWKGKRLPYWLAELAIDHADLPGAFRRRPAELTGINAIDERIDNVTSGYDAAIMESRAVITDMTGRRETHPFLDPRFIEGTYGFDPWWPVRGGHSRALEVEAFRDRLPPLVAGRQSKVEFSGVFWPQLLQEETLESVRTGPLSDLGWLDRLGFDHLVNNAKEGMANAAIPLSRCVSVDRWLRSR